MSRDKRQKRDLHAFTEDGMVVCNPRDKEAAHRAEMEAIATHDRAAVFHRLHEIEVGKIIEVRRKDRRVATFTVDSVEQFPKASFPADRVLMHDDAPRLVIVTCGGQWTPGGYADNVIVFAHLV